MTDWELLARAAQAAQPLGEPGCYGLDAGKPAPPGREYGWNPLIYNCDAFELLVQLGMRLQFLAVDVEPAHRTCRIEWAHAGTRREAACTVPAGPAGMAIVRRAIVQAAAALGSAAL